MTTRATPPRRARLVRALHLAVLATACRGGEAGAGDGAGRAVVGARTTVVVAEAFTETLGAIGTVVGRPDHVATLSAPVQTGIVRVDVALGQRVQVGSVLVVFDQTSFATNRRAAEAALLNARRSHDRTRRLVAEGISPRKELDQATADLAQAEANAATARRQAALAVLRSPIAGVVTRVSATRGATADPTQPLVEVVDPTVLDIIFNVTPAGAARIRRGAKIQLSEGQVAAWTPLGLATVVDVSAAVDSLARGVAVRAQATMARRPLRLGESLFGRIVVATNPRAIVVPIEALVPEGETMKVFVVDAAGIAHSRPVQVGGSTDRVAEIISGLRVGERIVTYGAYGIDDGTRVIPLGQPGTPAAEGTP